MKWSGRLLWVSVTVVGMLCIPWMAAASGSSTASGGRIAFTGAIVEPTCGVAAEGPQVSSAKQTQPYRTSCTTPNGRAVASRIYVMTVVRLSGAAPDRVLKYFDNYVKAIGRDAKDPVLVTQIYE